MTEQTVHATWLDGQTPCHVEISIHHKEGDTTVAFFPSESTQNPLQTSSRGHVAKPLCVWDLEKVKAVPSYGVQKGSHFENTDFPGQLITLLDKNDYLLFSLWWKQPHSKAVKRLTMRFATGAIALLLLCFSLYVCSPSIFTAIAQVFPKSWEKQIGNKAYADIMSLAELVQPDPPPIPEALQANMDKLVARLELPGVDAYKYQITIIPARITNAVALPGGHIIVLSELIAECESPDELAGVLAHEMGHITERHGLTNLLQSYLWENIAKIFGGSNAGGVLSGTLVLAINSSYSRSMEEEADLLGTQRLLAVNIHPQGLISFFSRLEKKEKDSEYKKIYNATTYFSSHPQLADRQQAILDYFKAHPPVQASLQPALDEQSWQEMKAAAAELTEKSSFRWKNKGENLF